MAPGRLAIPGAPPPPSGDMQSLVNDYTQPLGPITAGGVILRGPGLLTAVTMRATTAVVAVAQLYDGGNNNGQLVLDADTTQGTTFRIEFGDDGVACLRGLFLVIAAGAPSIVVYWNPWA